VLARSANGFSAEQGSWVKLIPGPRVTSPIDQLTSLIPFVSFSDSGAVSGLHNASGQRRSLGLSVFTFHCATSHNR